MRQKTQYNFRGSRYDVEFDVDYRVVREPYGYHPGNRPHVRVDQVRVVSVTKVHPSGETGPFVPCSDFVSAFCSDMEDSEDVKDECMDRYYQYHNPWD